MARSNRPQKRSSTGPAAIAPRGKVSRNKASSAPPQSPGALKTISAREFAGRFARGVRDHKQSFTWFLGAGCSISSGIKDAGGLVEKWLTELHELQADPGENFEAWLKRKLPAYNPKERALHYAGAFEGRHPFPADRQREIEMICANGEPAHGYATMAQLLSHKDFGRFCNTVLTTNFDDLIADALYLYGERHARPLVITHEALARYVSTSSPRPIIVKLHGDAHIDPKNLQPETREIDASVCEPLYPFLRNNALVFVGYGGNDESILSFMQSCPMGGIAPPIYWVSKREPPVGFAAWLDDRGALRVDHTDFDQLMHLIRGSLEIELLDKKRWNGIGDAYYRDFVRLKKEIEGSKSESEDTKALKSATAVAQKSLPDEWAFYSRATQYEHTDPNEADHTYKSGLTHYPNSNILHGAYASFLENVRKDMDAAEAHYKRAIEADPKNAGNLGNYANFLRTIRKDMEAAEAHYKRALDADPKHTINLGNYASFLADVRQDMEAAEAHYKRALDADPKHTTNLGNYANFLKNVRKDMDAAEAHYKRALDADPKHATNLGNYANFLGSVRKDMDTAEAHYKRALEADPKHAGNLGNYAQFVLGQGRKEEGLELLEEASSLLTPAYDPLRVELLIYSYAHDAERRGEALSMLKAALVEGARTPGWNFAITLERAAKDGHPEMALLRDLTRVANGEADITDLDNHATWRAA